MKTPSKKLFFCLAHGVDVWIGSENRPNNNDYRNACDFLKTTKSTSPCEYARRLFILNNENDYNDAIMRIEKEQKIIRNKMSGRICRANSSWTIDAIIQSCFDDDARDFSLLRKEGDRRYLYAKQMTDFLALAFA